MIYTKRSGEFITLMNTVHMGTNYAWIAFETLIIPTQIEISANSNTLSVGIIAAIGISIGVLVSLISGTVSDHFSFLWGRRGPYILFGSAFASISIILDLLIQNSFIGILMGYILVQTGTNVSSGAYQPLFRDLIKEDQRGFATGINGVFTLLGNAFGLGVSGYLISIRFYDLSFIVMAGVLSVTAVVTTLTIKHDDLPQIFIKHGTRSRGQPIIESLRIDRKFASLVIASFTFFLGLSGLSFFEMYYFKFVLLAQNPTYLVTISGIFVLLFSAAGTAIFGILSDKIGRLKILFFSSLISSIGMVMIPLYLNLIYFIFLGTIIGLGYGIFFSVSKALASDMSPIDRAGKYMAIYNISVGGSAAASPFLFGLILNYYGHNYITGFTVMFETAALFYIVSIFLLIPLRRPKTKDYIVPSVD